MGSVPASSLPTSLGGPRTGALPGRSAPPSWSTTAACLGIAPSGRPSGACGRPSPVSRRVGRRPDPDVFLRSSSLTLSQAPGEGHPGPAVREGGRATFFSSSCEGMGMFLLVDCQEFSSYRGSCRDLLQSMIGRPSSSSSGLAGPSRRLCSPVLSDARSRLCRNGSRDVHFHSPGTKGDSERSGRVVVTQWATGR